MKRLRDFAFLLCILSAIAPFPAFSQGKDYVSKTIGILKYVPKGQYRRDAKEGNINLIQREFRMSRYEITRAQYLSVMGSDPSLPDFSSGMDDPVQNMRSWYDAIEFCNKLSESEGLRPVYAIAERTPASGNPITSANVTADFKKNGYRLPTEMEWRWAAMGAQDAVGKPFAGSDGKNHIGDYAVFGYWDKQKDGGQTMDNRTSPVGSKKPNELGIYDLSGNVWEFVWDLDGPLPDGLLASESPQGRGALMGTKRVFCGGGYGGGGQFASVSSRGSIDPYDTNPYGPGSSLGFRVVRN